MKLSVGFWCKLKIGVDQFAKPIIFFQLLVRPPSIHHSYRLAHLSKLMSGHSLIRTIKDCFGINIHCIITQ